MIKREAPWLLKASGATLLALGLVLLSATVFVKAAFQKISSVQCDFTRPDGSSGSVSTTAAGSTCSDEVKDGSTVTFTIPMAKSADELFINEWINGANQGRIASWSSVRGGSTYSKSVTVSGENNKYTFEVAAVWVSGGQIYLEDCTFNFTVKAPPQSTTRTLELYCTTGGTTDPLPGRYTYPDGSTVTIEAIPSSGYQFSGWSRDASGTTNPLTLTMNKDYVVVANFSQISARYTLSVSVSPSGSGSVSLSPPGGTYASGTQVTLTATSASGYRFDSWSGSISSTSNPVTITMDGNKSVTAKFVYASAPSCTFSINNKEVSPTTMLYLGTTSWQFVLKSNQNLSGAKVTISGTANATVDLQPANVLTQWVGNWTAPGEGRYTVTCTASYPGGTVTAASIEMVYGQVTAPPGYTALVFNVVGQGSVSVTEPEGKTVVPENSIVRVQAFPAPGWRFKAWGGDVAGLSKEPYLSFMATGNSMMIIVEFEKPVGVAEMAWSFVKSHLPWILVFVGASMLISGETLERRRRI
jgi:uncharacterized repeat protein (TIGR02543 family)